MILDSPNLQEIGKIQCVFFIEPKVFVNLTYLYLSEIKKQGLIFSAGMGHLIICKMQIQTENFYLKRFFYFMHEERLSSYEFAKGFKALELDLILQSTTLTRLVQQTKALLVQCRLKNRVKFKSFETICQFITRQTLCMHKGEKPVQIKILCLDLKSFLQIFK